MVSAPKWTSRAQLTMQRLSCLDCLGNFFLVTWQMNQAKLDQHRSRFTLASFHSPWVPRFAWLPFHLGYTTLYHASKGRGVVRKVSPFI